MHSPLSLRIYGIESFDFKTLKDFPENGKLDINQASIKTDIEHRINPNDEFSHLIILTINVKPQKKGSFPYNVKILLVGFFDVDHNFEKDQELLADINGSSILYGAAREYIYLATSHGRYGPLTLPVISFHRKRKEEAQLQAQKSPESIDE